LEGGGHIVAMSCDNNPAGQAVRLDESLQFGAIGRPTLMIAHKNEYDVVVLRARAEESCRVDKNSLPFPSGQAGGHQNDSRRRHDAPSLAKSPDALRRNGHRIEACLIKPPVNDANALGGFGVTLAHDACRVLGIADDRVAARHHAAVGGLQTAALIVDAVVGRYEAPLGSAGGNEGAPGRRPASRVNEAHAALADESRKPQGIEQHQARILRFGGESNQLASYIGQCLFEPAATGYDERETAAKGYGFGDFNCCPLGSAGGKLRDDLQYDRPRISI